MTQDRRVPIENMNGHASRRKGGQGRKEIVETMDFRLYRSRPLANGRSTGARSLLTAFGPIATRNAK